MVGVAAERVSAARATTSTDARRRIGLRSGGGGDGGHRLDLGAGEAADDDRVEGAVRGEQGLGLLAVGGGDADRALGLAEAVEVVAVALVQVAVEGLLLGQ